WHFFVLRAEENPFQSAEKNGRQAQNAFQHCWRYLHGWMAHRDPHSGLIPRNLTTSFFWNPADAAADNYPFMVLTAALLEPELLETTLLEMLEQEIRLTNRVDNLPDHFDFAKQNLLYPEVNLERLIFGASEYAKDGLVPLTEWLGESPWSKRMIGMIESIWKRAPVSTHFGKIPSTSQEVNGEQLQVLCRLYWKSRDERYRRWVFRLADYYLLEHLPTEGERLQLDDHGCEIIGGLASAYYLAAHTDAERRKRYREPIHQMLDRVLEVGTNRDGLLYELVNPRTGEILKHELSDNWGYDYNAILSVAQLDGTERYFQAVREVLEKIYKYKNYPWEGGGADGYADAIEGGLNLLNRLPIPSALEWVDYTTEIMLRMQRQDGIIEGWHGDGNYARTALMVGLWKTQGTYVEPWRADLAWGAVERNGTLYLSLHSDWTWRGSILFDIPRHREFLNLPSDYPRINQFPEWFTVELETDYEIQIGQSAPVLVKGQKLRQGLKVSTEPKQALRIKVSRR
ncbi:MAG: hypothetical protein ACE5MK_09940, partial [Acidobacteriota bacterium]